MPITIPATPFTLPTILLPQMNVQSFGAVGDGVTDNTTVLQSAINAAIAAGVPLYIPAGQYNYVPPLTINGNLSLLGAWAGENWPTAQGVTGANAGDNVPLGTPKLTGAVLRPSSNAQNAINIAGTSLTVHCENFGISFRTPFVGTGHGINYSTGGINDAQGLTGAIWKNVVVYGHDGNHYAYNLDNFFYSVFINIMGFGGGLLNLSGNKSVINYGNSVFIQPYGQVICGGTAHGISLNCNTGAALNLMQFNRPQVIVDNDPTFTPAGNPPTSAQKIFTMSLNALNIRLLGPDMETNVGSPFEWNPHPSNYIETTGGVYPGGSTEWVNLSTPQVLAMIPGQGMQIQSGSANNAAGSAAITFPFPFTHACLAVAFAATGPTINPTIGSPFTLSPTGFTLTQAAGGIVFWIAYGY